MPIVTIAIDLAKNVFAVHGVDETGKAMLIRPRVPRDQLATLIAQLPACLIGMEACSGAHHWAPVFQQHGHTVKLMAPNLVAPYRTSGKRGKNDAADAAAICEAVTRPSMRFVPLKDEHQQATLCVQRTRQGFVQERTATYNRSRGLLPEFGVVLPQSPEKLRRYITEHLDTLPGWAKRSISDLLEHAGNIEDRLLGYDRAIAKIAREDTRSKRPMQLRGIGPTTASALLASIGAGHDFRNGRQVAAWIGLTPGHNTAVAVRRGWEALRRQATSVCAACWSTAPAPSLPVSARNRIASAGGSEPWSSAGATGGPPSRLLQRTRDWRGPH
ncbi:transposase [Paraburkholderia sp. 40]